jgi:hypothetical protein
MTTPEFLVNWSLLRNAFVSFCCGHSALHVYSTSRRIGSWRCERRPIWYRRDVNGKPLWWRSVLSRVRGSVTNNNGFWFGLWDLLALLLQSLIKAHNRWLPQTRSIPSWTTSVFSSTVTDLVLIYESVTSSASFDRWLKIHSWTLNFWILFDDWLKNELTDDASTKALNDDWLTTDVRVKVTLRLTQLSITCHFITLWEPKTEHYN